MMIKTAPLNVADDLLLFRQCHEWPNGKCHAGQKMMPPMASTRMFDYMHVEGHHRTEKKKHENMY